MKSRIYRILGFFGAAIFAISVFNIAMYMCLGGRDDVSEEFQLMIYLVAPLVTIPIVFAINFENIWYE